MLFEFIPFLAQFNQQRKGNGIEIIQVRKAEENIQEFLDLFGNNIDFTKFDENGYLTEELDIKTFPAFLINNKIKFSGVQPADKLREYFCEMNNLEECDEELTKRLI